MHINSSSELRRRWRRQIAARFHRSPYRRARGLGALGFLVNGLRTTELVEISRLTAVVVYDETVTPRMTAIRVAGYRARLGRGGVQWGGAENHCLAKDLSLAPQPFAKGMRIDSRNSTLLQMALRLDHRVTQAMRYEQHTRRQALILPRLWAGFRTTIAQQLVGSGEEFSALCAKFGLSADSMLAKFRREQDGLALFPADWVSSDLHRSTALFAELGTVPARQAFLLDDLPGRLCGRAGHSQYDFYSRGIRRRPRRRPGSKKLSSEVAA